MFVLNPDPYSLPSYRIGPFRTKDLAVNAALPDDDRIDDYFNDRFSGSRYQYTHNGRDAIHLALSYYKLKQDDVVTILTTSNNFYISGCVTKEIEKFCKWSRKLEKNTKVVFVNHEFGVPYEDFEELKNMNLPIIEDRAHSVFSKDEDDLIGTVGDFVIYSFPKMFPIQVGGLLVTNLEHDTGIEALIDPAELRYIKNVLSAHIDARSDMIDKRIKNYHYLLNKFSDFGFSERFPLKTGIVPGVFMFRTNKKVSDLPALKEYFYAHGVQCSVFYGDDAFYIPVHQSLNKADLDYFYEIVRSFMQRESD